MKQLIDRKKFGRWALVTGASSGIGEGFAKLLAEDGLNLVLVARRKKELTELARELEFQYHTQTRIIPADLAEASSIAAIEEHTADIDIGLLISNAGTGNVSRFFDTSLEQAKRIVQLNAVSHVSLVHHFGQKMVMRRQGGILLTGALGAVGGVPYMANEAGTKGYIESFGKSLHAELKQHGVHLTVLVTPPTETPVFYKLGFTLENSPISPLTVEKCVTESLVALAANKVTVLPGLRFRIINALTPSSLARTMTGKMLKKNNKLD